MDTNEREGESNALQFLFASIRVHSRLKIVPRMDTKERGGESNALQFLFASIRVHSRLKIPPIRPVPVPTIFSLALRP